MNESNTAILFTGEIHPNNIDSFIECTKDIKAVKIASVWNNLDNDSMYKLIINNFAILKNNIEMQTIFTPQFVPIINGINFIKLKHCGDIEFILRSRFDILSSDYDKYLEKAKDLYSNKITVISGINSGEMPYFLDIIVCGTTNNMSMFYALQSKIDARYPEIFLIENYSNKKELTKDEIRANLNFSLDICIKNNIEFIWIRPESWKSPTRTNPNMKVIEEYCKEEFIWV